MTNDRTKSAILLASESYEVTISCVECRVSDVIYLSVGTNMTEVADFLVLTGWSNFAQGEWRCPDHDEQ